MRSITVTIGVFLAVVGVSTGIWSARYASWIRRRPLPEDPIARRLQDMKQGADRQAGRPLQAADGTPISLGPGVELRPQIAEKGPFPKAVVGNDVYGFGRMSINEEKKHTFRIENKGQVPLVLAKGPTECKCIISNLSKHEVAPADLPKLT